MRTCEYATLEPTCQIIAPNSVSTTAIASLCQPRKIFSAASIAIMKGTYHTFYLLTQWIVNIFCQIIDWSLNQNDRKTKQNRSPPLPSALDPTNQEASCALMLRHSSNASLHRDTARKKKGKNPCSSTSHPLAYHLGQYRQAPQR